MGVIILISKNAHLESISCKNKRYTSFVDQTEIERIANFYNQYSSYETTPLLSLPGLASIIGINNIYVKDESTRLGLDSFKALGGFYAIARLIAEKLEKNIFEMSLDFLKSDYVKKTIGKLTFVTATDGNHGKGVAMAATALGHNSIVYLPKGAEKSRVEAIKQVGGTPYVSDYNYDETVKLAFSEANKHGFEVVQDTALPGYETIPKWIMQGYAVIAKEILDEIEKSNTFKYPTHVIYQAGVGSVAGAIQGYLVERLGEKIPTNLVVEPSNAACMLKSAKGNGDPKTVTGDLDTVMAGLSCGEPNPIGWEIIKRFSDYFISVPDWVAARGVRILNSPIESDPQINAGESGGIGIGLLSLFMLHEFHEMKDLIGLTKESNVLLINTEGITDPYVNRKIIWDGKYPTPSKFL
ncbi:diaminopropionate ammonia-lyase [Natranaerobius trueperi]|uniref:Diaminopropionate ammonia-lyase n=1 Tax=Natranaerobius trueperi TaxID=759412 RepID=A0A226BUH8_9FIRM|nr:diaminopropionate ammonia-lyase [Natranaerobius trueperi]OWZ82646.1 diaminopropionate ammonia-lyase [Natranaerobius trueperi]